MTLCIKYDIMSITKGEIKMKKRVLEKITEERKTLSNAIITAKNKAAAYCTSFISKNIIEWTDEEIRQHQAASKALADVEGKVTSRMIELDNIESKIRSLDIECIEASEELQNANSIPAKNASKGAFVNHAQKRVELANNNLQTYLTNIDSNLNQTKLTTSDLTLSIRF